MYGFCMNLEYPDQNVTSQRSDILNAVRENISLSFVPSEQEFISPSDRSFKLATHFQVG